MICRLNYLCLYLLLFSFSPSATAQNQFNVSLKSNLDRVFKSNQRGDVIWGCSITDLSSNASVYSVNSETPLIPASNQKIIVIASSLLELGAEYRSHTVFHINGPIENGVLNGNLIISGHGAIHFTSRYPTSRAITEKNGILSEQLDALVNRIRSAGIVRIKGDVAIHTREWTDMPRNKHYPSAAAVSFHENTIDVVVRNEVIRSCPENFLGFNYSESHAVYSQNRSNTGNEFIDSLLINPSRDSVDYWRLEKTSPISYYRTHIRNALISRGIGIDGTAIGYTQQDRPWRKLFALESIPLEKLLRDVGIHSDNFRAETVFLNLGYMTQGIANYQKAGIGVKDILSRNGIDTSRLLSADGSGLSRNNRTTPATLSGLLQHMLTTSHKKVFLNCFATAGHTGTLASKLTSNKLKGRILGKTGTLRDVTALSGYILTRRSRPALAFSFICNNSPGATYAWSAIEEAMTYLVTEIDSR